MIVQLYFINYDILTDNIGISYFIGQHDLDLFSIKDHSGLPDGTKLLKLRSRSELKCYDTAMDMYNICSLRAATTTGEISSISSKKYVKLSNSNTNTQNLAY